MSRSLARRLIAAGIVSAALALIAPSLAPAADGTFSSCRASATSVVLLGGAPLEPTVANAPGSPCVAEVRSTGTPSTGGTLALGAASAETTISANRVTADARLTDVGVNLLLLLNVGISAANAQVGYTCANGVPVAGAASQIAGITINGATLNIVDPTKPATIDLGPIAKISLNQTTVTANSITQRAIVIESELLATRIVIGEATASISGNPCTTGGVPNPPDGTPPPTTTTPPTTTGPGQTIFVSVPGFTAGFNTGGQVIAGACAQRRFTFNVRGRGLASTTYFLDGRRVKKVGRNVSSSITVDPSKLSPGAHRIRAVTTFLGGRVKPKTLNLSFLNCGGSGISILSPTNFGRCANLRVTSSRAGTVFVGLYSGRQSIRAFAQALVTFRAPGSKRCGLPIPNRARTFIPRTTRRFATLTKLTNPFISRIRVS